MPITRPSSLLATSMRTCVRSRAWRFWKVRLLRSAGSRAMSRMCCSQAARMSISRSSTRTAWARQRALDSVRPVVPKPGMVTASTPSRRRPSRSKVRTATSRARVESRPPDRPSTARFTRVCSSRRARPAVWMEKISSQRMSRVAGSSGTKGWTSSRRARRWGRGARMGSRATRRWERARACTPSAKEVCRARSTISRSVSTSVTSRSPSRLKRSPSASSTPFSATRSWPPKTTSVVDSWTPALA